MVMLTEYSENMLGPGAHSWAWGREGELTCKYSLATDITENSLLKPLGVDDKFLNLFKYK